MQKVNTKHFLHFLIILSLLFILNACIGELDFTGFVRSTDRIEDRFRISMAWNDNHPYENISVADEHYQLLIAGDIHVGTTNNLEIFLTRAAESDISAMVFTGDNASGKEEDYERFNQTVVDNATKPYFVMTGNHELYFDGWKHFKRLFGTSVFYFSVQTPSVKDLYICLDSGSGSIGKSQLQWLKNTLKEKRADYDQCIVFSHVNIFRDRRTASTNPPTDEVLALVDLFETYHINMVIMGHDHKRSKDVIGQTTYLTLDALRDGLEQASYIVLRKTAIGDTQYEFHTP